MYKNKPLCIFKLLKQERCNNLPLAEKEDMEETEIINAIGTGKAYKVYKTKEWQQLREEILKEFHYECQMCKEKGIITIAQTVHHVKHIDKYPHLAYSKYYIDRNGIKRRNLIPLCNRCHNKEHNRFKGRNDNKQEKPLTEEFW